MGNPRGSQCDWIGKVDMASGSALDIGTWLAATALVDVRPFATTCKHARTSKSANNDR